MEDQINVVSKHQEIRPLITDHIDFFPETLEDLKYIKHKIAFYVLRKLKLKTQAGTLMYLYDVMGTFRNFYIALKVWCDIQDIISRGGSYLEAVQTIVFSDSDIANLIFFDNVKYNLGESINTSEQLQALAKIPYRHSRELTNSHSLALEARARLKLEKQLRYGATPDEVLEIVLQKYGVPNKWESVFYKIKTREELIQEAINNHSSSNNPMNPVLPSLKVLGNNRSLPVWDLIREAIR